MSLSRRSLFLIAILLSGAWQTLKATDIGGFALNSGEHFNLPHHRRNFLGLDYSWQSFGFRLPQAEHAKWSYINAQVYSLRARVYLSKSHNLQLMGILPIQQVREFHEGEESRETVVEDIPIMIMGTLWHRHRPGHANRLWLLGAGAQFPVGKHQLLASELISPGLQAERSNGTIDFMVRSRFHVQEKHRGLMAEVAYRYNTCNDNGLRFGNNILAQIRTMVKYDHKEAHFIPFVGLGFELIQSSKWNDVLLENSGGHYSILQAGLDFYEYQHVISAEINLPIHQRLSENQLIMRPQISLSYVYMLGSRHLHFDEHYDYD